MNLGITSFVCNYCSRSFTRKYNLQTHIGNCHLNSSCHCQVCDYIAGSPAGLQMHLSRGHNSFGQPFPECDICGRILKRKPNIVSHMITVHLQGLSPKIKCNLCQKTFTTQRILKRHVNQLHNPNIQFPTCDICKKVFKSKQSLIDHIKAVHDSTETGVIKCNLCNKVYTNERSLKRHIDMLHIEGGEFKCKFCAAAYCTIENLHSHIRNFHKLCRSTDSDVDSTSALQCESCSKTFKDEPSLRQHIKKVHSFEIFYEYCRKSLLKQEQIRKATFYKCEYCHNYFDTVYILKDHMRSFHDKEYSLSTCNICFNKFYSKEAMSQHKMICLPPENAHSCSHCDKLFTDISSLYFHIRIFHPQAQIADPNVTSTNIDDSSDNIKCPHCDRVYHSDRSLKHHTKLKHTTDMAIKCEYCGKVYNNKYYLASHMKIVHNNDSWSKCDYCNKQFKSKRSIRRHIEYSHLRVQRYKCIECETLFKEKRTLRKHVRTKHPNSAVFSQCHICYRRFESAKSCKIHLKLLHSFNMNTFPCDLCSASFSSNAALSIHLQTKHLAKDEIYKCEECNLLFKGQEKFEQHNDAYHMSLIPNIKQKVLPRCIICIKDFSTRKTLRRHIKKFHEQFDEDELAAFGSRRRHFNVECAECIRNINDDSHFNIYQKLKYLKDSVIFKCDTCGTAYNSLEYSIQRYKLGNDASKSKIILSDLCTAEMSDESSCTGFGSHHEIVEAESTTNDISIKTESVEHINLENVKTEPTEF